MTNFIVNSLEDTVIVDGEVTLREAIEAANTNMQVGDAPAGMPGLDTIDFDALLSGGTITLTSGELQITDDLTINGLGADELTVSGNNASRVFNVDDGTFDKIEVLIDGLTIADGLAEGDFPDNQGGGILNQENLTVTNSTLSGNTAGSGGGIFNNTGDLTVSNSTISGNTAERGGGIENASAYLTVNNSTISGNTARNGLGGGILPRTYSTVEVTNSTISDNMGDGISGGITAIDVINSTISGNIGDGIKGGESGESFILGVINSTISGNTGDGIEIIPETDNITEVVNSTISGNSGLGFVDSNQVAPGYSGSSVQNTIIAGNNGSNPDVVGEFNSQGFNLIGNGDGASGFTDGVNGDQVGTSANPIDPLLGPLQDNGGPTETQALLPGSPAIDAGDPDFEQPPEFDQRGSGFPRVLDGDVDGIAIVDIGAFEFSEFNIIDGTPGNDLLPGTPNSDQIDGFGGNDLLIGNQSNDLLIGGGDRDRFAIAAGDGTDTIPDFGGVGTGVNPSQAVIDEVDTIQFFGSGLTPENMLLTQNGLNLEIAFEGVENTKVILQNFELEDLDNLTTETGASVTIGNILFDGQIEIEDSFDVVNANDNRTTVFNPNTVTFLNDLDNTTQGFEDSNDVINGQGGNDILLGRSGDDLLRGNNGDDVLLDGGAGEDRLDGGAGNDGLFGGAGADQFVLRAGDGTDTIFDFEDGIDSLLLADGLEFEQLEINPSNGDTLISVTDTGELLASLIGVDASDLTMDDFTTSV